MCQIMNGIAKAEIGIQPEGAEQVQRTGQVVNGTTTGEMAYQLKVQSG